MEGINRPCEGQQSIGQWLASNLKASRPVNVSSGERVASLVTGGLLLAAGMRRGSLGGTVLGLLGANLIGRGASGYCMVSAAMGRDNAGPRALRASVDGTYAIRVDRAITINRPPHEAYSIWRDFEQFPRFMQHVESVTRIDDQHSHWVARAPLGRTVEWDAVLVNDEPNRVIAWRSLPGSDVANAGSVRFVEIDGGTEIRVTIEYYAPGGILGRTMAKLFGEDPSETVTEDLRRFKMMMEGEQAHAAQPLESSKESLLQARPERI